MQLNESHHEQYIGHLQMNNNLPHIDYVKRAMLVLPELEKAKK